MNGSTRATRHSVIPAQAGIQTPAASHWIPACARMTVADSRSTPHGWRWAQDWRELLFAHWRVPRSQLQRHLPAELDIDAWQGHAWVSAVAFRLRTRPVGWPSVPFVSHFLELNLRTYVRCRDRPAVWFMSMHGGSRFAVWLGCKLTPLPYSFAPIRLERTGQQRRFQCGEAHRPLFAADFRPFGETRVAAEGTLDSWLLERYTAVVGDRMGGCVSMAVEHPPWAIQSVAARIDAGRLGTPFGLELNRPPDLAHYSDGVAARAGSFEAIDRCSSH